MGRFLKNRNPTPVSTFNVLADPEGCEICDEERCSLPYVCPLDTTREVYLTADDIEAIGTIGNPFADELRDVPFYNDAVNKNNNARTNGLKACVSTTSARRCT